MTGTQRQEIEDTLCQQFVAAWSAGEEVEIEKFLPPPEDERYLVTLERLVVREMDLAWVRQQDTLPAASEDDRPPRVEDYLQRFPVLEEREIVQRLCQQEFRVRVENGDRPAAEEYLDRFLDYFNNKEQVTCAATAAAAQTKAEHPPSTGSKLYEGQKLDQFRLVAPYAQGGFGAVWHAEDESLGRPVALKTLRGMAAEDAIARRRFVTEARVTARLEHPGIVPVHQAGRMKEDDPYYTMKLVQGETLAEAIAAYYQQPSAPKSRGLKWRRLLEAILAVCRTMEYAHAQGVIHRDLKPQNIVLGEYGETILLDWGLAKDLFAAAPDETIGDLGTTGYQKAHVTHPELVTRDGSVQGTPAYMSPEQAAGRVEEVDRRSDVYAIGAMLYQVLTGHLPYEGDSAERILTLVRDGSPPVPHEVAAHVPPALEAICLKAMARQREDRYGEMRLLREDLENYLAGEPVACYRESLGARAARWIGRHRTLAAAAVTSGLVALLALGAVAAVESAGRTKLAGANEQLEDAIAKANEANAQLAGAQAELETQYTALAEKNAELTAANEHIVSQQDRGIAMVESMLARYHQIVLARMEDLEIDAELQSAGDMGQNAVEKRDRLGPFTKDALALLGRRLDEAGRYDECEQLYQTLIAAYRYLHETFPESLKYESNLAQAYTAAAYMCDTTGRLDEAHTYYARALNLLEDMSERDPANADYQARMANVWHNQGLLNRHRDNLAAAEQDYLKALGALDQLVSEYPNRWIYRSDLAATQANLGAVYHRQGDQAAAIRLLEMALENRTNLTERYPKAEFQRYTRAGVLLTLASVQWVEGNADEALAQYEFAAQENDALLEATPGQVEYLLDAGKAYMGAAQVVANNRLDAAGARGYLELAIERFETILTQTPEHAEARELAFTVNIYLAQACMELEDWEAASRAWFRVDALNPGQDVTMYRYQYNLTRVLAGHYDQVDKAVEVLLADEEQPEMLLRFNAAVLFSAAAEAALEDSDLSTEQAVRDSERFARDALRELDIARDLGLFEVREYRELLTNEPRLAFLRERTDFRDLQRVLEAQYGEQEP